MGVRFPSDYSHKTKQNKSKRKSRVSEDFTHIVLKLNVTFLQKIGWLLSGIM